MKNLINLFLACFFLINESNATDLKHTNFIIIYLDDVGYGDITFTGALNYSTPNIEQMASGGMFFSHYYAPQAVCSASRIGLLTGCYPNRVGFSGALDHTTKTGIHAEEETMQETRAGCAKVKGLRSKADSGFHVLCTGKELFCRGEHFTTIKRRNNRFAPENILLLLSEK